MVLDNTDTEIQTHVNSANANLKASWSLPGEQLRWDNKIKTTRNKRYDGILDLGYEMKYNTGIQKCNNIKQLV